MTIANTSDRSPTRRLTAVLRFLGHVTQQAEESGLFDSVVQAGAIWYDLEARIYRRNLDGAFALAWRLPGMDADDDPAILASDRFQTLVEPVWLTSLVELEQVGFRNLRQPLLVAPVMVPDETYGLITVAGELEDPAVRGEVELAFLVIARALGACLDRIESRRAVVLGTRLAQVLLSRDAPIESLASRAAETISEMMEAAGVRLLLDEGTGVRPRILAATAGAWGPPPVRLQAYGVSVSSRRLALSMRLAGSVVAVLEIEARHEGGFRVGSRRLAEAAARSLALWLHGIVGGRRGQMEGEQTAPWLASDFEVRLQEAIASARRAAREAAILVFGPAGAGGTGEQIDPLGRGPLVAGVRQQLRASDLLGRLATGEVGAVLTAAGTQELGIVADRIRRRLEDLCRQHALPAVRIGKAAFPADAETARALVERARRDLLQMTEGGADPRLN